MHGKQNIKKKKCRCRSIPGKFRDFSFLQNVQTVSGSQPFFYLKDTGGSFAGTYS